MKPRFTIRVYGIYIKDRQLLLSRENFNGVNMLKFPGGGLEYGEGTLECLKREMQEEFKLDIEIKGHFYTTDFFTESAFHEKTQVMSIYYLIDMLSDEIPVQSVFTEPTGDQMLLWYPLAGLDIHELTFPIDQKVAGLLREKFI